LVACALVFLGVALAAGRVDKQRPWLNDTGLDQQRLLVPGQAPHLRSGHVAAAQRRLARARALPGGALAISQAVALTGAGVATPGGTAGSPTAPGVSSAPGYPGSQSPADSTPPGTEPEPKEPTTPPGNPSQPPTEPNQPPTEPEQPSTPSGNDPVSTLYWGASIGSQLTGEQAPWDMSAVTEFEQIAGKQVSLVNFFGPFANCSTSPCSFYRFPTGPMESIHKTGAIPIYSWSSQSIPSHTSEPDFQLADVAAGTYDSYIREFAEDARDWGHPFFLRFDWEMNGSWFPWGEGANGNQPGQFVAAWRHVHDIFSEVGADNVTWVWCPNVDPDGIFANLSSLYPGDDYVDWTGLDGYNWGLNPAKPDRWRSFDELFEATYHRIADQVAPNKPLLIGEIGSTEKGGSKASWIEEALTAIPVKYPKIGGLVWFDTYDDGMDWPIETSASAAGAFAEAIQSPAYVDEGVTSPSEGPIAPPPS
jgi:hypothetical protein